MAGLTSSGVVLEMARLVLGRCGWGALMQRHAVSAEANLHGVRWWRCSS
jgi:hypothetical protein